MLKVLGVLVIFLVCVNAVDVSKHLEKYRADDRSANTFNQEDINKFRKEIENHGVFQQCWDVENRIYGPTHYGLTVTTVTRTIHGVSIDNIQHICIPPRAKYIMENIYKNGYSVEIFSIAPEHNVDRKNTIMFFKNLGFSVSLISYIDNSLYEYIFSNP